MKKHLPVTYLTFLIGTLAISGIPPLAGFFSKDQILAEAFVHNKVLFVLGMLVSLMTVFYMFRLFYLTFHGQFRGTEEQHHHLHESPANMTIPLIILAVLSVFIGFVGFPHALGEALHIHNLFDEFLKPVLGTTGSHMSVSTEITLMLITTVLIIIMIIWARSLFVSKQRIPQEDDKMQGSFRKLAYGKFYIDEFYNSVFTKPVDRFSEFLRDKFDLKVVDGLVNGLGKITTASGQKLRLLQSGNAGYYAIAFVFAIILLFLIILPI